MRKEQRNGLDFKGQNIYVGIDVHLKSWSVSVLSEHSVLKKFSQNPQPEASHKFLVTNYPGANYYSVYEAGFCGFWIHAKLVRLGITNIVVKQVQECRPTMIRDKMYFFMLRIIKLKFQIVYYYFLRLCQTTKQHFAFAKYKPHRHI